MRGGAAPVCERTHRGRATISTAAERIWSELDKYREPVPVAIIAEGARCSQTTARRHLRNWTPAGYVDEHIATRPGRRLIKYAAEYEISLDNGTDEAPPIRWTTGGKVARVHDPDDPERYTVIDHRHEPPRVTGQP